MAKQIEHGVGATFARWIEQHSGGGRLKASEQRRKDLFGHAGDELTIGAAPALGVVARSLNGEPIVFNPDERVDGAAQLDAEETDPAVNVDEMTRAAAAKTLCRDFHQFGQLEKVVLEE